MTSLGVRVCIRARPLIQREAGYESQWELDTCDVTSKNKDKPKHYIFDRVFNETEKTSDVYEEITEPIVLSAMQGFNGTVFAYGQTASGKTYTMTGSQEETGIIPLAINDIFNIIEKTPEREFLLRMSYMEIYNDNLKDLLSTETVSLCIREDEFKSVRVHGLVEKMVASPEDVMQFLEKGERLRHMGSTNMNVRSSRSHTIFKMVIESRERVDMNKTTEEGTAVRVSQLNFVDLAGSERARQTGAEGQRLKEGCYINTSLMILGQVINQICKDVEAGGGKGFISFRDSKLTRILQSSLGGNSLTAIICTVTVASLEETESTLRFASSAKNVKNKPIVNEVLSDEALLFRQKKEINQLRKKISALEKENELNEKSRVQRHEYEEKIDVLTRMLLVSSRPATFASKKLRRETWCPGAKRAGGKEASPFPFQTVLDSRQRFSTLTDETFVDNMAPNESPHFSFPSTSKRVLFDDTTITTRKRSRMDDDDSDADNEHTNKKLKLIHDALIKEQEKNIKLQREIQAANQNYEDLKKRIENNFELRSLQEHLKMQENVIDQFKQEKDEDEEERNKLEKKITELSSMVVGLERREIKRIENDSVASALQGDVKELRGQLEDTCLQNRKLQEQYDEEMDRSVALNSSLKKLNSELDHSKAQAAQIAEGYEAKMHSLQSQLEASKSVENDEKICDASTLSSTTNTEKDALIKELRDSIDNLKKQLPDNEGDMCEKNEDLVGNQESKSKEITASMLGTSGFCGERTACLEDAVVQCEMLVQEKIKLKQEIDDMVFQVLEKDKELQEMKAKVTTMTSHMHTLEEQAQFDRDEKEILFAEEKELQTSVEELKNKLVEAKKSSEIEKPIEDRDALVLQLKESVSNHERSAKDAEALLHDTNFKLAQADSEVKDLKVSLTEKESLLEKLQADLQSYISMAEITGLQKAKKHELRRSTDLNSENENLKKQLEERAAKVSKMEKNLHDLTENLEETTMLLESEREAFMECNTTMEEEIKSQSATIENLEERVKFYTQELDLAKNENESFKLKLDEKVGEICNLQLNLNQNLENELQSASNNALSQSKNEEHDLVVEKLKMEIETKVEEILHLKSEIDDINKRSQEKNMEISQLEEKLQSLQQNLEAERDAFNENKAVLEERILIQNEEFKKLKMDNNNVIQNLTEQNQLCVEKISLCETENEEFKRNLEEKDIVIAEFERNMQSLPENSEGSAAVLNLERSSLENDIVELKQKCQNLSEELSFLETNNKEVVAELKEKNELKSKEYEALKNESLRLTKLIEDLNEQFEQCKNEKNGIEKLQEQQLEMIEKLQEQINSNSQNPHSAQSLEAENLLHELEEKSLVIAELHQKLQNASENAEKMSANFEADQLSLQKTSTELQKQVQSQNEELCIIQEQKKVIIEEMEDKFVRKSKEFSILESENESIQQKLKESSDEIAQLTLQMQTLSQNFEKANTLLKNEQMTSHANPQLQDAINSHKKEMEQLEIEKNKAVQKLAEQIQVKTEQCNKVENENNIFKEDLSRKAEECFSLKTELSQLKIDLQLLESKKLSLDKDLMDKATLLEGKDKEVNELVEKMKNLEESRTSSSSSKSPDIEDLKEDISVLELQKRRCVNECKDLEKRFLEKEEEAKELHDGKKDLEENMALRTGLLDELKRKLEEEQDLRKSLLSKKENEIAQLISEKERREGIFEEKQNALLLAESHNLGQNSLIEELKSKIENFELILRDDGVRSEQLKLLEEQSHLSELEKNFIVVYHEYEQLTNEHKALVQSYNAATAQLQERNEETDQSGENLNKLKEKLALEQNRSSELEKSQEKLELEIQNWQKQLSDVNAKKLKLESRLEMVDSERNNRAAKRLFAEKELKEVNMKLSEVTEKSIAMEQQSQGVKCLLEETKIALEEKSKSYESLKRDFNNGIERYKNIKDDFLFAQNSVKELTSALEKSREEKSSLLKELVEVRNQISSQTQLIESSEARVNDLSNHSSALEEKLKKHQDLIKDEREAVNDLESARQILEKQSSELSAEHVAEITKWKEQNDSLKTQLHNLAMEHEDLRQELSNHLSKGFESSEQYTKLQEERSEKDAEIAKLQRAAEVCERGLQNAIDDSKAEMEEQVKKEVQRYVDAYEKQRKKLVERENIYKEKKRKLEEEETKYGLASEEGDNLKKELREMKKRLEDHYQNAQDLRVEKTLLEEKVSKTTLQMDCYKNNIKQLEDTQKSTEKRMQKVHSEYQTKIVELQEKLRASDQRSERLHSLRGKTSAASCSREVIYPGSFVQRTLLDVQELEMAKLKQDLREHEKSVAKYKLREKRQNELYGKLHARYQETKDKLYKLHHSGDNKENEAQKATANPEPDAAGTSSECDQVDQIVAKKPLLKFDDDGPPEVIILNDPVSCPDECKQQ